MSDELTHDELTRLLDYSIQSGVFTWKVSRVGCRKGARAGCVGPGGYMVVRLKRRLYLAHRLAWFYVMGVWPSGVIDHRNRNRSDNWFFNLRDVSQGVNAQNQALPQQGNRSGFLGVSLLASGKYMASIAVKRSTTRLGVFDDPEEAREAYLRAKATLHPEAFQPTY